MKKKRSRLAPPGVNQSIITLIENLETHLQRPVRSGGYVHRIRVDIKRLRAWIRLIRNEEDTAGLRGMDHELRDIMKKLSSRRDRQALMETLKWLEKKTDKDTKQTSLKAVRSHLRSEDAHTTVDWDNITKTLVAVLAAMKQHTRKFDSMHLVRDGLQRTYKRAAKLGDKAFSGKIDPVEVHEFRKWAKYLFYQLGYIQAAYPELYQATLDNLDDLGRRLGRYHDLVLVKSQIGRLTETKSHAEDARRTELMIETRMHKLLRRSERLFRDIFSESSSKFVMDLP